MLPMPTLGSAHPIQHERPSRMTEHHNIRPAVVDRAVPIDQLYPHPLNARRRDARAEAELRDSLTTNGQYRAIVTRVVRRRGGKTRLQVLAGHGTLEAARQLGWTHIAAEQHTDVDDQAAARIVAVDNRTSDLAYQVGYDTQLLAELIASIGDLTGSGYTPLERDDLIAAAAAAGTIVQLTDPDKVPPVPAKPRTKAGELWLLGPHRLAVGDATRPEVVARAVGPDLEAAALITDPPYNVNYTGGTAAAMTIANDNLEDHDFAVFLTALFAAALGSVKRGGPAYVFHADTEGLAFRASFAEAGWDLKQALVWVKDRFVLGRQDHHWQHEPILYGWRPGAPHAWYGGRTLTTILDDETPIDDLTAAQARRLLRDLRDQGTVLREPRPAANDLHPTMKPTHLLERLLNRSTKPGDQVLDVCAGSGSLVIACHATSRRAAMVELDPAYADVIARRWQEHTGILPTRENGTPVDFTTRRS